MKSGLIVSILAASYIGYGMAKAIQDRMKEGTDK